MKDDLLIDFEPLLKICQSLAELELIYRLASEMIVDGIIPADSLRTELIKRQNAYMTKYMTFTERKHPVYPV